MSFEQGDTSFAVTICEDIWHSDGPTSMIAAGSGIDVILNLSASPYYMDKSTERIKMLRARAAQTGSHIAYVNCVGGQDELVFDGGSMMVAPKGNLISRARQFDEELHICTVEHGTIAAEAGEDEEVYAALVLGTRDYARKNGFHKAVIGLSGGIDSALTAAIAVDALGAENVTAVTMPSRYTSDETLSDAGRLAESLEIKLITMPIEKSLGAYEDTFSEFTEEVPSGTAFENIQARIRGNFLMALSNQYGWLVLTTGNKSEVCVGYCTLYGDMAGGFNIIKDVFKTMVYRLARHRNEKEGHPLIPVSTIERPPSAELREDQKDTDSLPPYETLDAILKAYVEQDRGLAEITRMGYDEQLTERVISMVDRTEYKRRQAPPGVKITQKSLGKDRRLPLTNKFISQP